jgi:hypothetical protein
MHANTKHKASRPSRHETDGRDRAPAAAAALGRFDLSGSAVATQTHCSFVWFNRLVSAGVVFKRPPCGADLKRAGRDLAKDLGDGQPNKPECSGPARGVSAEEACFRAVTTRRYREGEVSVGVGRIGARSLSPFAKAFCSSIVPNAGALALSAGSKEIRSHADI